MDKTVFSDLPLETVLQIVNHLDNGMDRLCLALTCRSLQNLLDKDKSLQRSHRYRAFKIWFRLKPANALPSDGRTLLRKLEDSRWRCCFGCFKLHPAHEFSARDLETSSDKRTCIFGPLVGTVCLYPLFGDYISRYSETGEVSLGRIHITRPKNERRILQNYKNKSLFFWKKKCASHRCSYLPNHQKCTHSEADFAALWNYLLKKTEP